jgi:hypothetical protein
MTEDIDVAKTILALLSSLVCGGGFYALLRRAIKRAGASGWEFGIWVARADLARLRAEAAEGRAAKARADAVVKEAEARVAKAVSAAEHACQRCEKVTHERDQLALRIAQEGKP